MSDDRLADAETVFDQLQGPRQLSLDTAFRTLQSKSQLGCVAIAGRVSELLCSAPGQAAAPCPALLSALGAHPVVGPLARARAALDSYASQADDATAAGAGELRCCEVLWRACVDVCAMASFRLCGDRPSLPAAVLDMLPYLPADVMASFLQLCGRLAGLCVRPAASPTWLASGVQLPRPLLRRWPAPPADAAASLWDTVVAPRLAASAGTAGSGYAREAELAAWRMAPLLCSVVPQHIAALDLPATLQRTGCAPAWVYPPGSSWRSAGFQLAKWLQERASALQQHCALVQHAPVALLQCPAVVYAVFDGSARHAWVALVAAVCRSAAAQDPAFAGRPSVYVRCVPSHYLASACAHSPAASIARLCALLSILQARRWVLAVHALRQLQQEAQPREPGHPALPTEAGPAWCCALASSLVWLEPALQASQAEHGSPQSAAAAGASAELVQWLLQPWSACVAAS